MAEYVWTFYIGKLRIGWLKHYWGWIFNRKPDCIYKLVS